MNARLVQTRGSTKTIFDRVTYLDLGCYIVLKEFRSHCKQRAGIGKRRHWGVRGHWKRHAWPVQRVHHNRGWAWRSTAPGLTAPVSGRSRKKPIGKHRSSQSNQWECDKTAEGQAKTRYQANSNPGAAGREGKDIGACSMRSVAASRCAELSPAVCFRFSLSLLMRICM